MKKSKLIGISLAALLITCLAAINLRAEPIYLAVGAGGQRMFAKDGQTWENHVAWGEPKHDQNDLNCAAFYKGTAYVGGGFFSGRMTATRDGKTWSEGVLPKSSPIFGLEVLPQDLLGVHDTLYAVDLRGKVFKTVDGENWTLVGAAQMPSPKHWIRFTKTGNGIILGCGDFGPALAFDPKTEKITVTQMAGQTVKNPGFKYVAFGNGTFVVCGQDGLLATTKDGITWQNNETHPERGDITSVISIKNHFVAVTRKNGILTSIDGLEWKHQETKLPTNLLSAGEWFYAHGWPPSKVQCSHDGVNWTPMPNEQSYFVYAIVFGDLAGTGSPPNLPGAKAAHVEGAAGPATKPAEDKSPVVLQIERTRNEGTAESFDRGERTAFGNYARIVRVVKNDGPDKNLAAGNEVMIYHKDKDDLPVGKFIVRLQPKLNQLGPCDYWLESKEAQ